MGGIFIDAPVFWDRDIHYGPMPFSGEAAFLLLSESTDFISVDGNLDREITSLAKCAFHANMPAVHFYKAFRNCQSEAGAAVSTGVVSFDLTKTLEDHLMILLRDTDAIVFYG